MIRPRKSILAELPSLRALKRSELASLDSLSTLVHIGAGRQLMRQGEFGNEALILVEGELLVERDGDPVAVLTSGAIVGEQAVLLNQPRNATVTAATDVVVAAMNRREFSTLLETCPTLSRFILETAVERGSALAG